MMTSQGLAVDVVGGDLYWTSSSGHLVFKVTYTGFNQSYARENPWRPVYVLGDPDFSRPLHNNESVATAVSADGLTGDFGKDPSVPPLLLFALGSDPDDGDAGFGSGDRLLLRFDRPTNVSEEIITEGVQPQEYAHAT